MSDDALSLMSSYFNSLWLGLKSVVIPGTDWSIADFFLAIFVAGMIGIVLKVAFKLFESHFGRGAQIDARSNQRYQETKAYRSAQYRESVRYHNAMIKKKGK